MKLISFIAALPIVIGLAGSACAGQPTSAQTSAIRSACPTDYKTYCASIPPGGSASLNCLQQNVAKLSGACQSAVQATMAPAAPAASSNSTTSSGSDGTTAAPASKPAATAPAGPPLTPLQELALVRNACRADFRRLCSTVALGGGRAIACLEFHQASLSKGCTGAIAEVRGQ